MHMHACIPSFMLGVFIYTVLRQLDFSKRWLHSGLLTSWSMQLISLNLASVSLCDQSGFSCTIYTVPAVVQPSSVKTLGGV